MSKFVHTPPITNHLSDLERSGLPEGGIEAGQKMDYPTQEEDPENAGENKLPADPL